MILFKMKKAAKQEQAAILNKDKEYAHSKVQGRDVAVLRVKRTAVICCCLALFIIGVFGGLFAGGIFSGGRKQALLQRESAQQSIDSLPSVVNPPVSMHNSTKGNNCIIITCDSPEDAARQIRGVLNMPDAKGNYIYFAVTEDNREQLQILFESLGAVEYSVSSSDGGLQLGYTEVHLQGGDS